MAQNIDLNILVDIKRASRQIERFSKESSKSLRGVEKAAKSIQFTGIVVGLNQGIQLIQQFTRSVVAAIDPFRQFESSLVAVGKTTNLAGQELAELGNSFRELAQQIPVSVDELTEIGVIAGQLGIQGSKDILKFSETVAKLTRTTVLGASEASDGLAKLFNILQEDIGDVDRFAASLVQLGNTFATDERAILALSSEIARSASEFDLASQDVAALAATLKALGQRTEGAGTQIGRTFRAIQTAVISGGVAFQELERITGITGDQLRKTFAEDSFEVFQRFVKGLNLADTSLGKTQKTLRIFGLEGERLLKVIPALVRGNKEFERAVRESNSAFTEGTALNEEFNRILGTLDTTIQLLKNAVTEISIALGDDFADALKTSIKFVTSLIKQSARLAESFKGFGVDQTKEIQEQNSSLAEQIDKLNTLIKVRAELEAIGVSPARLAILNKNIDQQEQLVDIELQRRKALVGIASATKEAGKEATKAAKSFKDIGDQLDIKDLKRQFSEIQSIGKNINLITLSGVRDELRARLDILDQARKASLVDAKRFQEIRLGLERDAAEKIKKIRASIAADPIGGLIVNTEQIQSELDKLKTQIQTQIDIDLAPGVLGGINQVLKGAAGATQLLSSAVSTLVEQLLPGLGAVAGEIFNVLAQGPEQVRELVQGFVNAIPQIVENVILAIPILIEELAKATPVIVEKIIERIPEIIRGLVRAIPRVAVALAAQAPRIATAFAAGFIAEIPNIVKAFVEEIGKQVSTGFGLFGGGGGGGVLGSIGSVFGFAHGGVTPSGHPGDTIPALLRSNERVLSPPGNDNLEALIERLANEPTATEIIAELNNDSRPVAISINIGQRQLSEVLLDLQRQGFRIAI